MPNKCKKCPPEGAPEWVMTFGDMMSILLTFFILLLSLSEIKKKDDFRAIMKEVKKAFGMHGGGGRVPTKDDPELSFIERIKVLRMASQKKPKKSNAQDPGMDGREHKVTSVRDPKIQELGGRVTFEPGSADLTDDMRINIRQLANLILGYRTKIHVDGHADTGERVDPTRYGGLLDLSFARAVAVHDYLISDECQNILPVRIKLIANADSEKLIWDEYRSDELRTNRRVEITVSDRLVDDMSEPEMNRSN